VDIATTYELESAGLDSRWGKILSLHQKCPEQFWNPPGLLFDGYLDSLSEVKQPGSGFCPSPSSSTEVKKEWCFNLYSRSMPSWCGFGRLYLHFHLFFNL
jgi:hypothetical protein